MKKKSSTSSESHASLRKHLETLFTFDRQLLGGGYEQALGYINDQIGLTTIEVPSGQKYGSWTVPNEWTAKDAWVKFNGRKVIDFKKDPMHLITYSLPFSGKVTLEELKKHLYNMKDKGEMDDKTVPFVFKFYDREWGFAISKEKYDKLKEGDYEVFIDVEEKPGTLKIGEHIIPGKSEREILLFAHLDHAWQANDNLSGVVCLMGLADKLKCDHTIKLVFCPETIGSIAYAYTQNLDNVDFVIAVDICGNDNTILTQLSYRPADYVNRVAHCALQTFGKPYRKGPFRTSIGSDETVFNDPNLNLPGLLLTTWPYEEYHTNKDVPAIINYDKIVETQEVIKKIIEIYEKDYLPVRPNVGPLMRSRYGLQSHDARINLNMDYIWYAIDGERSLAQICADLEMNFDYLYGVFEKVIEDGQLLCLDVGEAEFD